MEELSRERFDILYRQAKLAVNLLGAARPLRHADECFHAWYDSPVVAAEALRLLNRIGELRASHRHSQLFEWCGNSFTSAHALAVFRFAWQVSNIFPAIERYVSAAVRNVEPSKLCRDLSDESRESLERELIGFIDAPGLPHQIEAQIELERQLVAAAFPVAAQNANASSTVASGKSGGEYVEAYIRNKFPDGNETLSRRIEARLAAWRDAKPELEALEREHVSHWRTKYGVDPPNRYDAQQFLAYAARSGIDFQTARNADGPTCDLIESFIEGYFQRLKDQTPGEAESVKSLSVSGNTVTVHGVTHGVEPHLARWLQCLIDAKRDGGTVTSANFTNIAGRGKNVTRELGKLYARFPELKDMIQAKTGGGYWLK